MSPTPPPSFLITSPYDSSSHPVIPSLSFLDDENVTSELISPSYAPPWKTNASSAPVENHFSTNAPTTPPPRSRSATPRPMNPEKQENRAGDAWFSNSRRSSSRETESKEKSRLARGRALRINNLHQRVYHPQEISPLPYPPDGFASHQDSFGTVLDKDCLPLISPILPSPSKTRSFRNSTNKRFYERLFPNFFLRRILSLPDSPPLWLALYFTLNLTLTLYNKSVLIHFPFPYTLTALHAFCGTIGTFILIRMDPSTARPGAGALTSASPPHQSPVPNLSAKELLVLFLFSILYTLNIVVSNASLRLVTVPVSHAQCCSIFADELPPKVPPSRPCLDSIFHHYVFRHPPRKTLYTTEVIFSHTGCRGCWLRVGVLDLTRGIIMLLMAYLP